jgi:pSer/pThr/pTyr-binding forkhead associated (FHA) protein
VPCEDVDTDFVLISAPQVAPQHARVHSEDGAFYLTDLKSKSGTWITNIGGGRYQLPPAIPVRIHQGDRIEFGPDEKAVYRVKLRKPQPSAATASAPAVPL